MKAGRPCRAGTVPAKLRYNPIRLGPRIRATTTVVLTSAARFGRRTGSLLRRIVGRPRLGGAARLVLYCILAFTICQKFVAIW